MRTTSVYDPEYRIGGHQPRGYTVFQPLFKFYRVHGFRFKISVKPEVDSPPPTNYSSPPFSVYVYAKGQSTPDIPTIMDFEESSYPALWRRHFGGGEVKNVGIVKGYVKPWVPEAVDKRYYMTNSQYIGSTGAAAAFPRSDPAAVSVTNFVVYNESSLTSFRYCLDIDVVYYVEFFDAVSPAYAFEIGGDPGDLPGTNADDAIPIVYPAAPPPSPGQPAPHPL